jgi:hypothetical protein
MLGSNPSSILELRIAQVIAAKSSSVEQTIGGSTFLGFGFGCGIIFVGYAGISELLPNRWRLVLLPHSLPLS